MTVTGNETQHSAKAARDALLPLVLDVAVPLGGYYLLQHLGVSVVLSLALSGLVPAVRTVWSVLRHRRADALAMVVLAITVISIPISFITGSPRVLLAKESIGTGPFAIFLIISALVSRPAMANAMRGFLARTPETAAAWERLSAISPVFRSHLNACTMVWGIGFAIECAARLAVVFLLPVRTAVWATNIPLVATILACIVVQSFWARRVDAMIRAQVAEDAHRAQPVPALV
jgi:intracellular septation protein A